MMVKNFRCACMFAGQASEVMGESLFFLDLLLCTVLTVESN